MKSIATKAATAQAKLDAVLNLIAAPIAEDRRATDPVEVQVIPTKLTAAEKRKNDSRDRVKADVAKQLADAAKNAAPIKAPMGEALIKAAEKADIVDPAEATTGYNGPMRALRDRVKAGKYTKAANGQPSCGDEVAQTLGALEPVEVIRACMVAMDITNPYTHLNIGQQSMNLRNKLRGAIKRGDFGMGVLREAVEVILEGRPAKIASGAQMNVTLTKASEQDEGDTEGLRRTATGYESIPEATAQAPKAPKAKRAPKPAK